MKQRGFTIVELLIVIVVIGILAAISVIAFNGVQENTRVAAVKADLSQASKALEAYKVGTSTSGLYPVALSEVGIASTPEVTYQFFAVNSANPASYCLQATRDDVIYYTNGSQKQFQPGSCQKRNYVTNPSLESTTSGYSYNTVGTTGTQTIVSGDAAQGNAFMRRTITNTIAAGSVGPYTVVTGLNDTATYSLVAYVRTSIPTQFRIQAERRNSSGVNLGTFAENFTSIPANTWVKLTSLVPPLPTMDRLTFTVYSGAVSWTAGSTIDIDGLFLSEGDHVQQYYDGSSPGWSWDGTANASTSTGPAY